MTFATFENVPDAPVIALARLRLERMRLKGLTVTNRAEAIRILRSMRPPPPKGQDLGIRPAADKAVGLCRKCHRPLRVGELCKDEFNANLTEHIDCRKHSVPVELDRRVTTALEVKSRERLYRAALDQIKWR